MILGKKLSGIKLVTFDVTGTLLGYNGTLGLHLIRLHESYTLLADYYIRAATKYGLKAPSPRQISLGSFNCYCFFFAIPHCIKGFKQAYRMENHLHPNFG